MGKIKELVTGVEEFCQDCDTSSQESTGEYLDNVWYCDKCAIEAKKPQHVPQRIASEHLREIRKEIDDEKSTT